MVSFQLRSCRFQHIHGNFLLPSFPNARICLSLLRSERFQRKTGKLDIPIIVNENSDVPIKGFITVCNAGTKVATALYGRERGIAGQVDSKMRREVESQLKQIRVATVVGCMVGSKQKQYSSGGGRRSEFCDGHFRYWWSRSSLCEGSGQA